MPFRYISQRRQLIKAYFSGIGKTAVICPAAFLTALSGTLLAMGMVYFLKETYHASASVGGMYFGIRWWTYAVACIFLRPVFAWVRPRVTLPISTFLMGAGILGIYFGGSVKVAYLFAALISLSQTFFWPPMMAWLSAGREGPQLGRALGSFNVSWSIGGILGMSISGWLSEQDPGLPLLVASGLFLLNTTLILGASLALPKVRNDAYTPKTIPDANGVKGKSTRLCYAGWVGLLVTFMASSMIARVWPRSANEYWTMSKTLIALLLAGRAITNMVGVGLLGRLPFWHYKTLPLVLVQASFAVALLLMASQPSIAVMVALLAVMGIAMATAYSHSMFHGVAGSTNRAARMGIHESLLSVGMGAGAVLGGFIIGRSHSIAVMCRVFAGILAVGIIIEVAIAVWAAQRERHEQASGHATGSQ